MADQAHEQTGGRWSLIAPFAVLGALAFSALFGFVILPLAQGPSANLPPWLAICRAIGLLPGTPAVSRPPFSATAAPVSLVQWTPRTMQILASANPVPGQQLAENLCSSCHGEEGMTVSDQYPRLAGQSPQAIYKQLSDFRSGARFNAAMTAVAKTLTDEQLAQVASYFGHVRGGPTLGTAQLGNDNSYIVRLINRGDPTRRIPPCEACHETNAGGPPEAPEILGQNGAYLQRQLMAFRAGDRRNDVYRRMRDIAGRLTPAEVALVADAYQGVY